MFERGKKDDEADESQGAVRTEPAKAFGSLKSRMSGSGEAAVIGRSIRIDGDLRGDEDLRIEGDVSGTVQLQNNALTIGKEGKVRADVYARAIAVDGETNGDLYASESIAIHVNARVQGNIVAPKVSIEEGAHFKGAIEMDSKAVEKALGKLQAAGNDAAAANKPARSAPKEAAKRADTNLNPPAGTA